MEFKFSLGSEVKDKITGFTGIVRGRSEYLTGCNTYGIQSQKLTKENVPAKWEWLDEHLIGLVKKNKIKLERKKGQNPGGPLQKDHIPPC